MTSSGDPDRLGDWIEERSVDASEPRRLDDEIHDSADAQQLLIHSLLLGHHQDAASRERRIQAMLDRFDAMQHGDVESASRPAAGAGRRPAWASRVTMVVTSLAATLLVICGIWFAGAPTPAEAAVDRAIRSLQLPVTRVYRGTIQLRWLGRETTRECDFYSQSTEQFVAQFVDLPKPFVVGANGDRRWVVAGNWSWSSDSEVDLPRDFLLDRMTIRYLQFNALFTRIPSRYDTQFLAAEPLPGEDSVMCRPIEATLRKPDPRIPDTIRFWSHPETGVVRRMHVIRNENGRISSTRIEIDLVGEEEVPSEFFELDFHRSHFGDNH